MLFLQDLRGKDSNLAYTHAANRQLDHENLREVDCEALFHYTVSSFLPEIMEESNTGHKAFLLTGLLEFCI
jgi:hypothetical protein